MKTRLVFLFSAVLAAAALRGAAPAGRAPSKWHSVQTDAIACWKRTNNAPAGVVADRTNRVVRFLVEGAGVSPDDPVEFFAVGPLSDRAYESYAMTFAAPDMIAAALAEVGVPRGVPPDAQSARFWPQGERLRFAARDLGTGETFELEDLLSDGSPEAGKVLPLGIVATGGSRAADGSVEAATNIPCAVFALYNCRQAPLLLPAALDQSTAYGRFHAKRALPLGALLECSLSWSGVRQVRDWTLFAGYSNGVCQVAVRDGARTLFAGALDKALVYLHGEAAGGADIFARLAFAPEVTVAQATEVARAFSLVDGHGVKLNGAAPGQLFPQAYLPDPVWRERPRRMFQPFEISIATNGVRSFTFVAEDWSGDGLEPKLTPRTTAFKEWSELPALIDATGRQGSKIDVMLIFAPKSAPIGGFLGALPVLTPRIRTFYVFGD